MCVPYEALFYCFHTIKNTPDNSLGVSVLCSPPVVARMGGTNVGLRLIALIANGMHYQHTVRDWN